MTKALLSSLRFAAFCLPWVSASAAPLLWTLSGVTFNDGATASGSFLYDADTNGFPSIDVTTTTGSIRSGAHYIAFSPSLTSNGGELYFVTASSGNLTGTPFLILDLVSHMTDSGGSINFITSFVAPGTGDDWFEGQCLNAVCSGETLPQRELTGGKIVSSIVSTPEPNLFWPTLLLLAGCLWTGYKNRPLCPIQLSAWRR